MGLWGIGGGMLIWLAGIKAIPVQLYEAAEIDGAGIFRKFFNVTLPMLSPTSSSTPSWASSAPSRSSSPPSS